MTILFENVSLPHALLVPKKSNVSDLVNRSYCFFKNAHNHALTPKSPLLTLDHMTVLFENVSLPHALLVPKKSNVSDLVNRSYCFFKNAHNHALTPKSPLLTLDHMTVLFENVSLPHALLVPQKSNVSDLVIRSYCFLKTPKITFLPLSHHY